MQRKYKLVLDVLNDGIWNIDVRDNGITIGHIMLSETGVSWKDPHGQNPSASEIAWANVKDQLTK